MRMADSTHVKVHLFGEDAKKQNSDEKSTEPVQYHEKLLDYALKCAVRYVLFLILRQSKYL